MAMQCVLLVKLKVANEYTLCTHAHALLQIFGESFNLSAVVVLLSVAFWRLLWGYVGAILSVPLLVCARITCLHLEVRVTMPLCM
jgi:hypothetical protein